MVGPAYFNGTVYYGGWGNDVSAFPIANGKLATAPQRRSLPTRSVPGNQLRSVSANGTSNGIVWAVENVNPAVLHAYDAATLTELYNSNQAGSRDQFGKGNKFIIAPDRKWEGICGDAERGGGVRVAAVMRS